MIIYALLESYGTSLFSTAILNKLTLAYCRHIISSVSRDTRLLSLVTQSGIKNTLITMLDQLQRCQKSLNEFLEVKNFICNVFLHCLLVRKRSFSIEKQLELSWLRV